MLQHQLSSKLEPLLACPKCKGRLEFKPCLIKCLCCGTGFPQVSHEWLNLFPDNRAEDPRENEWQQRLSEMEDWYDSLISHVDIASNCFFSDYNPYIPFLNCLSGNILDLGGGVGIPRQFINSNSNYIVVDPSLSWVKIDCKPLVEKFPCLLEKQNFILGIGENLPFHSKTFDAVLAFWSLNHASDPRLVFSEVARVLKSGGCFFLVLEEMIPTWLDLLNPSFPAKSVYRDFYDPNCNQNKYRFVRLRLFLRLIFTNKWPLQADHIRLREPEIYSWIIKSFSVKQRFWRKQYLTFELTRR